MCVAAQTVISDVDYGTSIVSAYAIEKDSEINALLGHQQILDRQ
jgi:hypothetical protein